MTGESSIEEPGAEQTQRASGWRRWLGVGIFVLALVLPLIALIVVPILGLPEGANAVLIGLSVVGGPDVLLVVSIAILGKDGVAELMNKLGSVVRRATKWDAVTRTRYMVGLWILVAALVLPTAILFFWNDSIADIGRAPGWGFWVLLISTFAFIGAVLSMGAPLWSRIKAIVTWEATIVFPDQET